MATLQKFKLLATQCAVAGSPSRSPSASPVIHLRRRKTLRMLLSRPERRRLPCKGTPSEISDIVGDNDDPPTKIKEARARRKLKDLFISSPSSSLEDRVFDKRSGQEEEQRELLPSTGSLGGGIGTNRGLSVRRGGVRSLRPVSAAFRYRLLRRAWRPVLVAIPE